MVTIDAEGQVRVYDGIVINLASKKQGPRTPVIEAKILLGLRRSAPKVLQHAKTLRIMLYTQNWGRLPNIGLGLCGRTFGADLRNFSLL